MSPPAPPRLLRLHLAVGLLSLALIAFQLVLMQILSYTQWHHFAYLVISVALLGFGAAGTLLSLARERLLACSAWLLPLLMSSSAAAMAAVVPLAKGTLGGFDTYLLFVEPAQIWRLLLVNLLFFVPFFLAALAIGIVFVAQVERIGSFYFANLLGSGLGGAAGIALLAHLSPERLPAAVAPLALVAGLLLLGGQRRLLCLSAALAAAAAAAAFLVHPPALPLSQHKDLRRTLNLPDARVVAARPSPFGQVEAVTTPALRHAPALSLAFPGTVPRADAIFSNGNWFGAVPSPTIAENGHILDYSTFALPYALARPERVLVLGAGTGEAVAHALSRGAKEVVAVEPHREVLELMREEYPEASDWLFSDPSVRIVSREPRNFIITDPVRYDLIVLPTVGAFGGTAGLFALQEEHALTKEGFASTWRRLAPGGRICASTWLDYPPRAPLRLAATFAENLEARGLENPLAHLAAVRNWGTITFCVQHTPLSAAQIDAVLAFSKMMSFDPALLPGLPAEARTRYNRLEDPTLLADLDRLFSFAREELYEGYPFRLRPVTDDRPFFSQYLRWKSLPHLARLLGERTLPFLELGYLVVLLSFAQMSLAAVVLIVLPLLRLGWTGGGRLATLRYFGGLAVGYMLVEIALIHRFVLYLGHPVYAAAVVITAVLVFSGAGSYASSHAGLAPKTPQRAAALVTAILLLYALLLPATLRATLPLPDSIKVLATLLLLAPPAFAMGFPFPMGLRLLAQGNEAAVPWAWGINGCLSVVSTALATIIAVEAGFTAVLVTAALAYGVAAFSD